MDEELELTCDLSAFGVKEVEEHLLMTNDDMNAVNTADNPDNVIPEAGHGAVLDNGILTARLGRHSWNVIRIR